MFSVFDFLKREPTENQGDPIALRRSRRDHEEDQQLPERIRKLPKDDPERIRYVKGWKEKNRNAIQWEEHSSTKTSNFFKILITFGALTLLLMVAYSGMEAHRRYMKEVQELRNEIFLILARKGYHLNDSKIFSTVHKTQNTIWIPTLKKIRSEATGFRSRIALDWSASNPETGSYISYIATKQLPFNESAALTWTAIEYRNNY